MEPLVRNAGLSSYVEVSQPLGTVPRGLLKRVSLDPVGLALQDRSTAGPSTGHLAASGEAFSSLVNATRTQLAEQLVANPRRSLTEISGPRQTPLRQGPRPGQGRAPEEHGAPDMTPHRRPPPRYARTVPVAASRRVTPLRPSDLPRESCGGRKG
ncbi:hypothetical protein [Streptomyces sp. NPDC058254]|uniref:hypothetical protein n=1 Tax=Streptomyces sp. NPDC058254 TaxID=3346406 RepID=UPI0036E40400